MAKLNFEKIRKQAQSLETEIEELQSRIAILEKHKAEFLSCNPDQTICTMNAAMEYIDYNHVRIKTFDSKAKQWTDWVDQGEYDDTERTYNTYRYELGLEGLKFYCVPVTRYYAEIAMGDKDASKSYKCYWYMYSPYTKAENDALGVKFVQSGWYTGPKLEFDGKEKLSFSSNWTTIEHQYLIVTPETAIDMMARNIVSTNVYKQFDNGRYHLEDLIPDLQNGEMPAVYDSIEVNGSWRGASFTPKQGVEYIKKEISKLSRNIDKKKAELGKIQPFAKMTTEEQLAYNEKEEQKEAKIKEEQEREEAIEEAKRQKTSKINKVLWLSWLGLSIFFLSMGNVFDYAWYHYILVVLAIIAVAFILLVKLIFFNQ